MKQIILIILFIITFEHVKGQDSLSVLDCRQNFSLSPSMFIDKGQLGSFSYGINNSIFSPSNIMYSWHIPNYRKDILINEFKYTLSFRRVTFSATKTNIQALLYNSPARSFGYPTEYNNNFYEFDFKIIKSKRKYRPDFGGGLIFGRNDYPLFLSIGNSREKLKYYSTVEFMVGYIIVPQKLSFGLSYNFFKNLDLICEFSHEGNKVNQALVNLNVDFTKFFTFQAGVYHYNYDFKEYISSTDWVQAGQRVLLDVDKSASHFLLSGKVILHLSPFKSNSSFNLIRNK